MSDNDQGASLGDVVDAFMQPPRLVGVAQRTVSTDGQILIVSHVELWPWRVVVRGTLATRGALTRLSGRVDDRGAIGGQGSAGNLRGVVRSGGEHAERLRSEAMWLANWTLEDDVRTAYRSVGSHRSGNEAWNDFAIDYQPPVPAEATELIFRTSDGMKFTVPLRHTT